MQEILIQLLDCICLYIKQVPCQSGTIREKLLYFFIQHPKNIEIPTFFFAEKNTYFLFFLFLFWYFSTGNKVNQEKKFLFMKQFFS